MDNALTLLREKIRAHYRIDEHHVLADLLDYSTISSEHSAIKARAAHFVDHLKEGQLSNEGFNQLIIKYNLSTNEGIALMCLAEALLRIPDASTADRLIHDKLTSTEWVSNTLNSPPVLVNVSSWALRVTKNILDWRAPDHTVESAKPWFNIPAHLASMFSRLTQPVIRKSIQYAMEQLGRQFVMGETIEEALKRSEIGQKRGEQYSYDMLGEAAYTKEDAEKYFNLYKEAIIKIGVSLKGQETFKTPYEGPGISIKLTALHPRYEESQKERIYKELLPRLEHLVELAAQANIQLTIDAEESYRLDLSLDIIETIARSSLLDHWEGFGLAVQAYQKRAFPLIEWLEELGKSTKHKLMVRLVKGAYWDSEIKWAQMHGLDNYPVFTRKINTDVSFLSCAQKLFACSTLHPQLATHNAYTIAAILEMAPKNKVYELQRLHGMGEELHHFVRQEQGGCLPCRVYAPVGSHRELLPYLVRRLLENGSNSSFINQLYNDDIPTDKLLENPFEKAKQNVEAQAPHISLPRDIFLKDKAAPRLNSKGIDLSDRPTLERIQAHLEKALAKEPSTPQTTRGKKVFRGQIETIYYPGDISKSLGFVTQATPEDIETLLASSEKTFKEWAHVPTEQRVQYLEKAADLLEADYQNFLELLILEGGRTLSDAVAEVREAIDFLRYYAQMALSYFHHPESLTGYTGEENELSFHGRGTFVCISPWNFPLAIFLGQATAALAAGNCVIAKPAEPTPLVAYRAISLLHKAGFPQEVVQIVVGKGSEIGNQLVQDPRIHGIAFTGSTQTAQHINRLLAQREGPIIPLIAETGGINAMIVDSSALLEQVVRDVIESAFRSAGQRCSALRLLFVPTPMADAFITMLTGAMEELIVGLPHFINTDIGPVINKAAQEKLETYVNTACTKNQTKLLYKTPLDAQLLSGCFVAPHLLELGEPSLLTQEVFGPILHLVRYNVRDLPKCIDFINSLGYGLTFGLHSRIDDTIHYVRKHIKAGNMYVNRNMIGAVVGVQPFGGEGLSGTGPKAGGPNYLKRFAVERAFTRDITASGGNLSLLNLET